MAKKRKAKSPLTPEEREARRKRNQKRLENYDPVRAQMNALRREFSRSPWVVELMNDPATKRHYPKFKKDGTRAKVDGVEHLCATCGEWKKSTKKAPVQIDHEDPVIDPEVGFVDLKTYADRLWCAKSNLKKKCFDCHHLKSVRENMVRLLKEEGALLDSLEHEVNREVLKKALKRFTPKKLAKYPYPEEFLQRVRTLKARLLR